MRTLLCHTIVNDVVYAPFGAVDGGAEVAAANFSFLHRALVAFEFSALSLTGSVLLHGQVAVNRHQFLPLKLNLV